jgi:hypothetical protein
LLLVTVFVFIAINSTHNQAEKSKDLSLQNNATLQHVQEGRQTGSAVTCAIVSAFSQAGKRVITGPPKPPPTAQEQALEKLGFPPFPIRHQQQLTAGNEYIKSISNSIEEKIGHKGDGLVKHDGTIDCAKLAALSNLKIPTK